MWAALLLTLHTMRPPMRMTLVNDLTHTFMGTRMCTTGTGMAVFTPGLICNNIVPFHFLLCFQSNGCVIVHRHVT